MSRVIVVLSTLLIGTSQLALAAAPRFETDIRPIFREFCFDCHGATEKPEGGLDLRLVRFLERGGESGPAIVKGDAAASLLLKRVEAGEMPPGEGHVPAEKLELLKAWVAAGAPTVRTEPETLGPGVPISEEERSFWAYQPLSTATPAMPDAGRRERTGIDVWLRAAMPEGLEFAPDADRVTLIRRVYFDLVGLPPSEEEQTKWLTATSDYWYEELVNALLDSPHYGERWARHWLDVAGYADSEGGTLTDIERPFGHKYRDYVIRALNADKPFDRFLVEQLAGDELAGPKQGEWTPEQIELLTATGFLRMAADGTGSGDNSPEARNKVLADTLKIIGSALLGTSLQCAQCHDHRYDPLSHTDYFAVRAVFEPALDWQAWRVPNERLVSLYTAADHQLADAIEQEAAGEERKVEDQRQIYMRQALDKELEKFEEPLRAQLREAAEKPEKDRTPEQTALLDQHPSVKITPGVLYQYLPDAAKDLEERTKKIAEIRARKPAHEYVRALTEPAGPYPATRLFHRGDHNQPLQEIAPAALSVLAPEGQRPVFPLDDPQRETSGRRLAFAEWLVGPSNPLTPRVIVNRIWLHHFGKGLVATPGEFGKLGTTPSHPELLDWLAAEFVRNGWSLKQLHRLILTSTAWRQASTQAPEQTTLDPENRYYSRKSLQRLDAEILRDRMLAVSGTLDRQLFGPPVAIKEDETGQVIVDGQQTRRSLYLRVRRSQPVAMLQTFDAPVMEINCEARPVSTVATQSLMLLNGEFTLEQAGRIADRILAAPAASMPARPELRWPKAPIPAWTYGSGRFDEATQRVIEYQPLGQFVDGRWQAGQQLPDAAYGYVFLSAQGGHPGNPSYATVRRWTAPGDGIVQVTGRLGHGSENGDGVRGRVISSTRGLLGTWTAKHGEVDTPLADVTVLAGEQLDFVTDCQAHETSDSFTWTALLNFRRPDGTAVVYDSQRQFRGPQSDPATLPAQMEQAWRLILCRPPTETEFTVALRFAADQLALLELEDRGIPSGSHASKQVLTNLCQMLLNSNEFVYVD